MKQINIFVENCGDYWELNCALLDKTIHAKTLPQGIKALGNALKQVKKEKIEEVI